MTSQMVTSQVSVLVGTVPLFAVNRISLNERYELPQTGDRGLRQSTSKITRLVQIEAALLGADGPVTRLGLEVMADISKSLPPSSVIAGIPLVAGLTTLMDMQIDSLSFATSRRRKRTSTPCRSR